MLATGGGGGGKKIFSRRSIPKLHFFTKFFKKTWKFPNKKGTFDVNLVFTATFKLVQKGHFITKKGTFSPLKNWGGGHVPPVPPPRFLRPCLQL